MEYRKQHNTNRVRAAYAVTGEAGVSDDDKEECINAEAGDESAIEDEDDEEAEEEEEEGE